MQTVAQATNTKEGNTKEVIYTIGCTDRAC